ncbi:MAG: hypothetical protein QXM75_03235 [Candidatus Diapherotrites archaeon]
MSNHNIKLFNQTVKRYKGALKGLKGNVLIFGSRVNRESFFSIAPLSKALHEKGLDVHARICYHGKDRNLDIMKMLWNIHENNNSRKNTLLNEFISFVEKKKNGRGFSRIFRRPTFVIEMSNDGFILNGIKRMPYISNWFRRYDEEKMNETCYKIVQECYALKKNENFSIGFVLVPSEKMLKLPLPDYIDSFAIAYHMAEMASKKCKNVMMSSSTERESKLDFPEPISELSITLGACEYEKNIKEKPFEIFKRLSKTLEIDKWHYSDASFGIVGSGYHGKHIFGLAVGYPSPDRKTRWASPSHMYLKPAWNEQSKIDKRPPKTRVQITETIPLEEFIQTCNVDYKKMRQRNIKIKRIIEQSKKIFVESTAKIDQGTNLVIELVNKNGKVIVQRSDSDTRSKIDRETLKKLGIVAGMYDNLPGGEVFFTPKEIQGTAVGDVVINIDKSYTLSPENPLVVTFSGNRWFIAKAPKEVKKRIEKELKDSKKLIKMYEKSRSLPSKIVKRYKKNFYGVGEFAINTNPAAKLSRYLIVNEKLANMIHIALGSGFEPGTETVYHWDFVIDVPRQKINIKALTVSGKELYIIKNGSFVV